MWNHEPCTKLWKFLPIFLHRNYIETSSECLGGFISNHYSVTKSVQHQLFTMEWTENITRIHQAQAAYTRIAYLVQVEIICTKLFKTSSHHLDIILIEIIAETIECRCLVSYSCHALNVKLISIFLRSGRNLVWRIIIFLA